MDVAGASGMFGGMVKRLKQPHPLAVCLLGGGAAFAAYFSMYAFRKPFTAATYMEVEGWAAAVDFKAAIVIAQVLGYAISKFIGVKVVSEMPAARRARAIIALVGVSWLALILFAVAPPAGKVLALFLNGLPLGMIWGLVFGYLEGRRLTEVLGSILCASFIVSSGIVKSVGVWLMTEFSVPEFWMPVTTGLLFFPLLLVSVVGLSVMPPPDARDIQARTERRPMTGGDRRAFLQSNAVSFALLIVAYVLFTVFRDYRDNFAAEIWSELGYVNVASLFTLSEAPVAVLTLVVLASFVVVRDNLKALIAFHAVILVGALSIGLSTYLFQQGMLSPLAWMIASGAGLYFAYTPYNAMLFDRIIAATRNIGTAGFMIYVADASGYMGSVGLLLYKNLATTALDWLPFYIGLAYATSVVGVVLIVISAVRFQRALAASRAETEAARALELKPSLAPSRTGRR